MSERGAADSGPIEAGGPPGLVVSVHDVRPGNRVEVEAMLRELGARGVGRVSLLVMPCWHGKEPAFRDAGFVSWLAGKAEAGHELVLHGYFHHRVATGELRGLRRLVATHYTSGEGEFYDVDRGIARELIARGLGEMEEALGMTPAGFIAPAWLLGREAEAALREFSFRYTTRIGGILDLRRGVYIRSRSLVYSVRAAWRRACSLAWNSGLFEWLGDVAPLRVGLHPPDWGHASIRRQALGLIERALAERRAFTYEGWLRERDRTLDPAQTHQ